MITLSTQKGGLGSVFSYAVVWLQYILNLSDNTSDIDFTNCTNKVFKNSHLLVSLQEQLLTRFSNNLIRPYISRTIAIPDPPKFVKSGSYHEEEYVYSEGTTLTVTKNRSDAANLVKSTMQYLDSPQEVLFLDTYIISLKEEHIQKYLCDPLFEIVSNPDGRVSQTRFRNETEFARFKRTVLIDNHYGFLVGLEGDGCGHAVALFSNKDFVYFYDSNRGIVRWQKDPIVPANNKVKALKMARFFRANVMSYNAKYRIISCIRFRFPIKAGTHSHQQSAEELAQSVLTTLNTLCGQAEKFVRLRMGSPQIQQVLTRKSEFIRQSIIPKVDKIKTKASSSSNIEIRSQLRLYLFGAAKHMRQYNDEQRLEEDLFFRPIFNDFLNLGSLLVFQFYSNPASWVKKTKSQTETNLKVYIPIKCLLFDSGFLESSESEEIAYNAWLNHKSSFTLKSGQITLFEPSTFRSKFPNLASNDSQDFMLSRIQEYCRRIRSAEGLKRVQRMTFLSSISKKLKKAQTQADTPCGDDIRKLLLIIESEWDYILRENSLFITCSRAITE